MNYLTLNNGLKIPQIGYGTYQIPMSITERCVSDAISVGYRRFDTSNDYFNEKQVGNAIRNSGIPRSEFFVTTKINGCFTVEDTIKKVDLALSKIQLGYIDLMLIHYPSGDNVQMYKGLEECVLAGKIRSIGLSNFYEKDLQMILDNCRFNPVIDQNETHIYRQNRKIKEVLDSKGILLEAWSPLAQGLNGIFDDPKLKQIGDKYGKTNAQVALRFLVQQGILVVPKTTHIERMQENINIFDFDLSPEDMAIIYKMDNAMSLFNWF